MSLINQVLNDLEKRGTKVATGTDAVRAVPRPVAWPWWLLLVVGLALIAAALVKGIHRERVPPSPPPERQIVEQPKPPAADTVAQVLPSADRDAEPMLRLSFELSSIPLPVSEPPRKQRVPESIKPKPADAVEKKPAKQTPVAVESHGEYAGQPIKRISPQQQAADEYGQGLALIQQGRNGEALPHLEATLQLDPAQVEARLTLVGLLLQGKRNAEAERILQDGLRHDPKQSRLAMLLARMQVERGAMDQALATLQTTLPFADQRADYHAFVAAVLQRLHRHKEAITHYQIALHLAPDSAIWWMGLGISLQAVDADEDARDAFKRATDLHKLTPELQAFVEKQLKAPAK